MNFSVMPNLGRNGEVNLARRISGSVLTGFRTVDPLASFVQGQVGRITVDANGNPIVSVCTETSTNIPVGIFWCNKTISFYVPVVDESITFTGANSTINLAHPLLKGAAGTYVKFTNTAKTVQYTSGATISTASTDYVINYTNGTIQLANAAGPANCTITTTQTVLVTYMYQDMKVSGIDDTLGAGKLVMLEDKGEIATRLYDTAATFDFTTAKNGVIVCGPLGVPSTQTLYDTAPIIGKLTKAPTSSNVELHFKYSL